MVQVHPHTPQSFICCKKIAWPPTRAWVNTEWCCGSPVMVQKLLIDTDDFLSPCFQCFRELVAFVLTVDCGSSAMKGMKIKIMKNSVFRFLQSNNGNRKTVCGYSSRISFSIIDWFLTKNGQAIHASITYIFKPGCISNIYESKTIKLQKCVTTAQHTAVKVVKDEDQSS